jgi:drug/metabolite transporter (DMT)-like permease
VTQTNYAIPLWAVGLGAIAFGERLPPQAFAALALIALGLFVAQEGWRGVPMLRARLMSRP